MSRPPRKSTPEASPAFQDIDGDQVRHLIGATCEVTIMLDGNGTVLDAAAHDSALQKAMRLEWRGRPWSHAVSLESRSKAETLLNEGLADAYSPPRHINLIMKAAPEMPMLCTVVRLSGSSRSRDAARLVAVCRDLRDTMALQRRLVDTQQSMERDYWRFREAETRYRSLFQATSEAVLIVDGASLRVVEANPAAASLLFDSASKASKVVGVPLASLFATAAAEPLAAALASARSVGKHERLNTNLHGSKLGVSVAMSSFRQDQVSFLLVRVAPLQFDATARARSSAASDANVHQDPEGFERLAAAFVRVTGDAMAFTDSAGRVVSVNQAFARMAQLSSEEQARGAPLDQWLGRTGIELSVLLANLREGGSAGLFTTELRGALGLVTEVEIAASAMEARQPAAFAFCLRDVGRRLAPSDRDLPTQVPASAQHLTELVGRVPLKQIVAETSDLIERLSIETALTMTKDNRAMAAQLLGLSRQSLYVKLRRFGMGGLESANDD